MLGVGFILLMFMVNSNMMSNSISKSSGGGRCRHCEEKI